MAKTKNRKLEAPAVKKRETCSIKAWCPAMIRIIDDVRVRAQNIVRLTTGKSVIVMPVIYAGEHKQKGAFLNYCPFCGHNFGEDYLAASKKADQEEARAAGKRK